MATAFAAAAKVREEREDNITKKVTTSKEARRLLDIKEHLRQQWPHPRKRLYSIVVSRQFEFACGVLIMVNLGLVVVETDAGVDDGLAPEWVQWANLGFLAIYTVELLCKLYVFRIDFFQDKWNVMDFVVVGVDLIFLVISLITPMPSVSILRVFRLLKLARALKAAKSIRELKSLLRACYCALKAIFWGMLLLVMALLVWGILAVQLIHPINSSIAVNKPWLYEGCDRCPRAYGTVFDSMLTFWKQLVAGDSWGTLCEPIIEEANWTAFFFMLVLVTVNLTMLNCILAVVVEAGAAAAADDEHDKAIEREKTMISAETRLIALCHELDVDGSGYLSIDEFYKGYKENPEFVGNLALMSVKEEDLEMIIKVCDEDDSGDVDYMEFVEQLGRMKHSTEHIILNYVTDIKNKVNRIRPEVFEDHQSKEPADTNTANQALGNQKPENAPRQRRSKNAVQEVLPEWLKATGNTDSMPTRSDSKAAEEEQVGTIMPALPDVDEITLQELWDRIRQVNQDLVAATKEHSEKTRASQEVLDTRVSALLKSVANINTGSSANTSGFPAQQAGNPGGAEADVLKLNTGASGHSGTMAVSACDRLTPKSGCQNSASILLL